MKIEELKGDTCVADLLNRWPETVPVFNQHRMACIGCSMSAYETLSGAAKNYHLSLQDFLKELQRAIQL